MPWTETEPMKERMRFVADAERGLYSMTELCERYGISRRTATSGWLGTRQRADGLAGAEPAPHYCPIVSTRMAPPSWRRRQHPSWGPRKLLAWLSDGGRRRLAGGQYRRRPAQRPGPGPGARRRRHWQHPGPQRS
jgi:hypothetical protein